MCQFISVCQFVSVCQFDSVSQFVSVCNFVSVCQFVSVSFTHPLTVSVNLSMCFSCQFSLFLHLFQHVSSVSLCEEVIIFSVSIFLTAIAEGGP